MDGKTIGRGLSAEAYSKLTGLSVDSLRKRHGTGFDKSAPYPEDLKKSTDGMRKVADKNKSAEIVKSVRMVSTEKSKVVSVEKPKPSPQPSVQIASNISTEKEAEEWEPEIDQTFEMILWWVVALINIAAIYWGMWSLFPNMGTMLFASGIAAFIVIGLLILQNKKSGISSVFVLLMFLALACGECWLHKQTLYNAFNAELVAKYSAQYRDIICWTGSCLFTAMVFTTSLAMKFSLKENK